MPHTGRRTSRRTRAAAALPFLAALSFLGFLGCGPGTPEAAVVHVAAAPPAAPPADETAEPLPPDDEPPPSHKRPPRATDTGAPDTEDDRHRELARALFMEGVSAYDQGDYLRARDKFQAAYDLVPELALLFNIASAEMRLGNVPATCTLFRRYVAQGDPAHPRIQEVQRQLTQRCRTP